ncbi:MAG: DUF2318 domain-containing protein [Oscillospiraceae bacterium]|jgi:uncharacterized membrane protein|nr:DUF2318 domain-containing protein [Oscillospiraceae bacterium]
MKRILLVLMVISLAVILAGCGSGGKDAETGEVKQGGSLLIPVDEVTNTARFYPAAVDGTNMEVMAVKASDGSIRTAFNTCQVCNGSPLAYFVQKGDTVECQNCGNRFPMDRVGITAGGCNPVPITGQYRAETSEGVTISYETLSSAKPLFKVWKNTKQ